MGGISNLLRIMAHRVLGHRGYCPDCHVKSLRVFFSPLKPIQVPKIGVVTRPGDLNYFLCDASARHVLVSLVTSSMMY